jgi:hypothetical protein
MTDNTTMSDSIPQTVHQDDSSNAAVATDCDSPQDPERGDSYQDIYSPKFDIEVGETLVSDQDNGSQQSMWRAEVIWTSDDEDIMEEQYLAEHPAEAILGAIEQSVDDPL